ncbi:MAG: glutamine amidotransferase, partial [Candidatus Promineifilaceae bacterium]
PAPAGRPEVALAGVDAPSRVGAGEGFSLNVQLDSSASAQARLQVLAGGALIYDQPVSLTPGANRFSIGLQAGEPEFARYLVQVTAAEDGFYQNNQLAAFTQVTGPPRVLLVSSAGESDDQGRPILDETPQLVAALEATGLQVERATPAELPADLPGLSDYAAILLVNVNAKRLSDRKMAALESYVRDLGGGLVAVGGPESFGMGGYFRTPLEEALPVDMQIKDQERFPAVSIVLVMDRSGSMTAEEGGVTKIQLAAEGAVRVVELLNDFDDITVIPVDTLPSNPIGPAAASEREAIIPQIRQIGAGGGGIYVRAGLEAAAEALAESANQVKHIILIADGADSEQKEGVPELIEALTAEGVTVSVVAIGDGQDVPWLQEMAELGGGRYHFTDQAANLPEIFTQETTSIQRSYLVEERFFPRLAADGFARAHPIFRAMEGSGISLVPPLFGYVATAPKQTAQVILETELGDPLLAAWEYGLGRAVAWTSDATGRWAQQWVRWQGFPTFWSHVVRWSIVPGREGNVETQVRLEEGQAQLTVDARDPQGEALNNLALEANVVPPQGETLNLDLRQVAPGRYQASFAPEQEGAFLLRVAGRGEAAVGQTAGWVLGYSPEYRQMEPNPALLHSLAEISAGRDLRSLGLAASAAILQHNLTSQPAGRPVWPWLLGLAAGLLPFDIGVRRLALGRRDLA